LYAESVRFTLFHVGPNCSPTRSAFMTGRHEFKKATKRSAWERSWPCCFINPCQRAESAANP
jgi:hypothetical protein